MHLYLVTGKQRWRRIRATCTDGPLAQGSTVLPRCDGPRDARGGSGSQPGSELVRIGGIEGGFFGVDDQAARAGADSSAARGQQEQKGGGERQQT